MTMLRALTLVVFAMGLAAQSPPVGLVVSAGEGELERSGNQTRFRLREGDLLYAGDRVAARTESVIWFCPAERELRLRSGSVVQLGGPGWTSVAGVAPSERALPICVLPERAMPRPSGPQGYGTRLRRIVDLPAPAPIEARIAALPEDQRRQAEADLRRLATLEQMAAANAATRVVRASVLGKYRFHDEAGKEFERVTGSWREVDWPRTLVHEEEDLDRQLRGRAADATATGKVYALVIGISEYPNLQADEQLRFAHRDAEQFAAYLKSPRGGGLPEKQVTLLTNRDATVSAIRTSIATFLRAQAGPKDTVLLFLAAHGVVDERGAYIVTHNSDPEDLRSTALPMLELQELLGEESSRIGRVVLYVDVCRAGAIGMIRNSRMNRVIETFLRGAETYGLLASAPGENSVESERFGGGHGAFSYFLLRGLNGDADGDASRGVDAEELFEFVRSQVRLATKRKQNPRPLGDLPGNTVLVPDIALPGISLAGWSEVETVTASRGEGGAGSPPAAAPEAEDERGMEAALASGRLLPGERDGAFDWLAQVKRRLGRGGFDALYWENRLFVALLDRGQDTLLRYLRGDRDPQTREDFVRGAAHYRAALEIDPQAWLAEARALFCEARVLIFDRRYAEAEAVLERAARVDPDGAYIYNALGIAALEQANYDRAVRAFRDAARLAPHWLYPRHNLALALGQAGRRAEALEVWAQAIRQAPGEWWLYYGRGLMQSEMGRRRAAEESFRVAARLAQDRPEPLTALGFLKADAGDRKGAEQLYREALRRSASDVPARHNLAVLLAQRVARRNEAIAAWREILREDPRYTPSRLALAETLAASGEAEEAAVEYRRLLEAQPGYAAARTALAGLLLRLGKMPEAVAEYERVLAVVPETGELLESFADALARNGERERARDVLERARKLSGGREAQRIDAKRKALGGA